MKTIRQDIPDIVASRRLTHIQSTVTKTKPFFLFVCGRLNPPGHNGPDADPEPSIKSPESSPSVALHPAHHKPTMACYGKFMGELPIKY